MNTKTTVKKFVSKISNAFSTGGGGVNFEQNIQALFLLSLLIEGFCPIINEPTKKICFQAKHLGFDVDDLVIFTYRQDGEGKILCQIKHRITASERDKTFQEVIAAAWRDFNKDFFDRKMDRIILAVAQIALDSVQAFRFLNEQACASVDETEFLERVEQSNFSSDINRKKLIIIKTCIKNANRELEPTDRELWMFCRTFIVVYFDLDYSKSVNRTLAVTLIKSRVKMEPSLVWSQLVDYAAICNQTATTIDNKNIAPEIRNVFKSDELIVALPSPLKVIDNFIPILILIGAWDENNAFDKKIIENISTYTYEIFEAKARAMIIQNSDYLTLKNGIWKVQHKRYLFAQSSKLFFDDMIERLFCNAAIVLKQVNKCLESDTPYLIPLSGTHENSTELRYGIADGMCIMKYAVSKLCNYNMDKFEIQVITFVRDVLHGCDWLRLASLDKCLCQLAELDPDTFLSELEWNIIHKPWEMLKLFPKNAENIFGSRNYISDILRALEILSWSPHYVISTVRCLGLLEALPYEKTNWVTTPINSIVSVLLPWCPQTMADCEKQKNALLGLKVDNPKIFWRVVIRLLPNQRIMTTDNPRPRYIPISIPEKIIVLKEQMFYQYKANLKLALDSAEDERKLANLLKVMDYMDKDMLETFLNKLEKIGLFPDEEKQFEIWFSLCELLSDNDINENAVLYNYFDRIKKIAEKIEPKDIRVNNRRLYLGRSWFVKNGKYIEEWEHLETAKALAIYDIYLKYGIFDVEQFGREVNNLSDVGYKLGTKLTACKMAEVMEVYNGQEVSREFFAMCVNGFCRTYGISSILDTSIGTYKPECIADILSMIPFTDAMRTVISELLPEDNIYWEKASFMYGYDDSTTLKFVIEKLIKCKRYVTAINILGRSQCEKELNPNNLCKLLKMAGAEESLGEEIIDNYEMQQLIGWLQRQENVPLDILSDIEFMYLPILDDTSEIKPKALRTRLSQDANYFCSIIELYYKRKSASRPLQKLSDALNERLFNILFEFSIVPGTDWNGKFDESKFRDWMSTVTKWSKENDRYEVTMHTVGSGLSYSNPKGNGLPPEVIIRELNKPENDELRRGYLIGMRNQRGMHYVDPEGKPEIELSKKFIRLSDEAERMGYSRYSGVLRSISDEYKREAAHNIQKCKAENQEE